MARFEIVTELERFRELETDWMVLWRKTGAKAFQSYPWLDAWVENMGKSFQLKIGLLWGDDGTLAAILPMAIHKFWGLRILEWAGQAVCDYCDGVGGSADVQALWNSLLRTGGIDLVRLKNIASDARIATLFAPDHLIEDGSCFKVVSAWSSGDTWFQTLNKKKRNNFTRGQRILEEFGPTSMSCHEVLPDKAVLRRLLELKQNWLAATRQSSYLVNENSPDRLLSLTLALAKVDRLRLFVITCDNDLVAGSINIVDGASVGAFFAAYNPKYDRASPGIMLMTAYTRWAFNNGFTEIDYLRGDEGYKVEFANARVALLSLIKARSLRGHMALALHGRLSQIARFREGSKDISPTGGAYMTKAGTARVITVVE
jgi:CelD/BcsL family acetyltransferase involved in cellulose biosynthesis